MGRPRLRPTRAIAQLNSAPDDDAPEAARGLRALLASRAWVPRARGGSSVGGGTAEDARRRADASLVLPNVDKRTVVRRPEGYVPPDRADALVMTEGVRAKMQCGPSPRCPQCRSAVFRGALPDLCIGIIRSQSLRSRT